MCSGNARRRIVCFWGLAHCAWDSIPKPLPNRPTTRKLGRRKTLRFCPVPHRSDGEQRRAQCKGVREQWQAVSVPHTNFFIVRCILATNTKNDLLTLRVSQKRHPQHSNAARFIPVARCPQHKRILGPYVSFGAKSDGFELQSALTPQMICS